MSEPANKIEYLADHRSVGSKYNKPFRFSSEHSSQEVITSSFLGFEKSGGGGNMDNYITRPEFEEHKRHLDSRFDNIPKDITIAKDEVIRKIEETRKSDKRWFIGLAWTTGVTLLGVIVAIVGLVLQIAGVF